LSPLHSIYHLVAFRKTPLITNTTTVTGNPSFCRDENDVDGSGDGNNNKNLLYYKKSNGERGVD